MSQTILQRAMNGDSFEDLEIIDVHCHMGNFACFQFSEAGIDPDLSRMPNGWVWPKYALLRRPAPLTHIKEEIWIPCRLPNAIRSMFWDMWR